MQTIIDQTTLVPVGSALAVVVALIGCTWKLSARMTLGIAATQNLERSLKDLSDSLNSHVLRSDTRDEDNKREHSALHRCNDVQAQAIKGIVARIDEVVIPRLTWLESNLEATRDKAATLDRRVAVLESVDAG